MNIGIQCKMKFIKSINGLMFAFHDTHVIFVIMLLYCGDKQRKAVFKELMFEQRGWWSKFIFIRADVVSNRVLVTASNLRMEEDIKMSARLHEGAAIDHFLGIYENLQLVRFAPRKHSTCKCFLSFTPFR